MSKKKRPNGAGYLNRRSNGIWELRLTIGYDPETGKIKTKSLYARSQSAVLAKGKAYLAEHRNSTFPAKNYTVATWGEWYLDHHAQFGKLADTTIENYRYTLKLINAKLGEIPITDLKANDVEHLLLDLRNSGYSASTLSKVRGLLYQLCQAAAANDIVSKNVVAYAAKMRHNQPTPKDVFAAEEIKHMMVNLPQSKIGWSIRLMIVGLRKQELLALTKDHIDEFGRTISIEQAVTRKKGSAYIASPKTEASRRVVPVPESLRQYAVMLRESSDNHLIWESPRRPGFPVNPSHFDDLYYTALKSIGVRPLSPHRMRHTTVSLLNALGVPTETTQAIVGHTKPDMTAHYLHVSDATKREAVGRLDSIIM